MDLKFIGTGGAFDYEYGNSSAWITLNGLHILLDCGNSVYARLRRLELADQIDYILITHMHDDHVGSLSTTILHHKHKRSPSQKARILYPDTINGRSLRDRIRAYLSFSLPRPDEFVEFVPLSEVAGVSAIDTKDQHVKGMVSFGYSFEDENNVKVYSGDLGNKDTMFEYVKSLNTDKKVQIFHEMTFHADTAVHVYYKDLMDHLPAFDIYGYHIDPRKSPADNTVPMVVEQKRFMIEG